MGKFSGFETLESMSQAVWYNKWTVKKFAPFLNGDILEVGCGIGNFTNALTKFGNVWAIDVKKNYIKQTKKIILDSTEVGFGDIENGKYFFDKRAFDCIVCLNVLEHINYDTKALVNMYKLLATSGVLIILVPSHNFLFGEIDKSIGHIRRYEKDSLLKILESIGFKIKFVRILNFLGAIGWYVWGKILKDKKIDLVSINLFNLVAPFILSMENLIEPPVGTSILIIAEKIK